MHGSFLGECCFQKGDNIEGKRIGTQTAGKGGRSSGTEQKKEGLYRTEPNTM
jgi:hypothetical protein